MAATKAKAPAKKAPAIVAHALHRQSVLQKQARGKVPGRPRRRDDDDDDEEEEEEEEDGSDDDDDDDDDSDDNDEDHDAIDDEDETEAELRALAELRQPATKARAQMNQVRPGGGQRGCSGCPPR